VAERKRRGEDAAEEHLDLDEVLDDSVDDDAFDDDDAPVSGGRGGTAVKTKSKPDSEQPIKVRSDDRVGVFGRIGRFFREVVAELRKVIWPTRKELLTYASVVVVFVAVLMAIVATLDAGFAWVVLHVFGGSKK
jgi:preprotein translocase subunit SecE